MKRKRMLWVLPYYPYPPYTGGNVRIYNLLKSLSAKYDIHLVSYYDDHIDGRDISSLEKICGKVTVVKRNMREGELPLIFQYYYTPEMTKELETILKGRFDFIQIDFLTMAHYVQLIRQKSSAPVFYTEHDVSSFNFDKCFHNRHLEEKERYAEWVRIGRMIENIYPLFDMIMTVSENDAVILRGRFPGAKIHPVPTGTDCEYYGYRRNSCSAKNLVYVGHYIHYPNIDSVKYFLDRIFPVLLKKDPDTKFHIVGSGGKKVFGDLECDNIAVSGTVADIRKFLYLDGIFVAPIRLGIGIRGKILEAMSAGQPVVSTSVGIKGIGAEDGKQVLVADGPEEFAACIQRLREDAALRERLTSNARQFVEGNYSWPSIVQKLVGVYEAYT
ncbi:MAG: glycosyltransferase [Elusimicrobia bacterium]|nr:glycosyltransferase [Elusimicrobiota bacterium]